MLSTCDPFLKESPVHSPPPVVSHGQALTPVKMVGSECARHQGYRHKTCVCHVSGDLCQTYRSDLSTIHHVKIHNKGCLGVKSFTQPTIFLLPGHPGPHVLADTTKEDFYEFSTLHPSLCSSGLDLTPLSGCMSCHANHNTHITNQPVIA